ncbi:MAG: NYN domain-containing protein [Erysipelotrichaceae bacterium]|nr:NYN domain-containing protein [Erysipelotrichaceae bacterium]
MEKTVLGIYADVDAGKTTFCEALLHETGMLAKAGRVDNRDSLLDYGSEERKRGITITVKSARITLKEKELILLDTPGHRDFAPERRRAVKAIDLALLILPASEDISRATRQIFAELLSQQIPMLVFVNKMDRFRGDPQELRKRIKEELSPLIVTDEELNDLAALNDEKVLEQYLRDGTVDFALKQDLFARRVYIPCFFGSALKEEGIEELLPWLESFRAKREEGKDPSFYVYKFAKIGREKMHFLKMLGGSLKVKDVVDGAKIEEIRLYNGVKYENVSEAMAGELCAVKGLKCEAPSYYPPRAVEKEKRKGSLRFILSSEREDNSALYLKLREIGQEHPEIGSDFDPRKNVLTVSLPGLLAAEIFLQDFEERYGYRPQLSEIIYPYYETIAEEETGIAHYESLTRSAEVTVRLLPLEYDKEMETADLAHQPMSHRLLEELRYNPPLGFRSGLTLKAMRIEILSITTSRQDAYEECREALYRAINQGQEKANNLLIEDHVRYRLETEDKEELHMFFARRNIQYEEAENGFLFLCPARDSFSLIEELSRTGLEAELVEEMYLPSPTPEPEMRSELSGSSSSVFQKSGKILEVRGSEIEEYLGINQPHTPLYNPQKISDSELRRVWAMTHKDKERVNEKEKPKPVKEEPAHVDIKESVAKENAYLIDGYNLMHADPECDAIAKTDLYNARIRLIDKLADAQGYLQARLIVVFDAYNRDRSIPTLTRSDDLTVIFTGKDQDADRYIQENTELLARHYRLHVVSSDRLVQLAVFSRPVRRLSSAEFWKRISEKKEKTAPPVHNAPANRPLQDLKELLEKD